MEIEQAVAQNRQQALQKRIENDFTYHPPSPARAKDHEQVREICRDAAARIAAIVPEGREQAQAISAIEIAMFHANAGIARAPQPDEAEAEQPNDQTKAANPVDHDVDGDLAEMENAG